MLTNREIIKKVKIGGCLSCTDHDLVEFVISRNTGLAKSKVKTLKLREKFTPFKELLNEIP